MQTITSIASTSGVKGSVHGKNKNGIDKLIRLRSNLGVVDEFEHGDAIKAWDFDPDKLANGEVVKRMMAVVAVDSAEIRDGCEAEETATQG